MKKQRQQNLKELEFLRSIPSAYQNLRRELLIKLAREYGKKQGQHLTLAEMEAIRVHLPMKVLNPEAFYAGAYEPLMKAIGLWLNLNWKAWKASPNHQVSSLAIELFHTTYMEDAMCNKQANPTK